MTKDGFRALVKITELQICAGKLQSSPYNNTEIEMTGIIQSCMDADPFLDKPGKYGHSYARVMIDFRNDPSVLTDIPDEYCSSCIGSLMVQGLKAGDNPLSVDRDVRAEIRLSLAPEILTQLIPLLNEDILIEPIFFRKPGERSKHSFDDGLNGITSFIERVYFSPYKE